VTLKNAVLWNVTLRDSCKNRRFGGTYRLRHQVVFLRSVRLLLVTANVVPSSPILVTLMIEAIRSSETSVVLRATWRHIPKYGIFHTHFRENLKSYIVLTGWTRSFIICTLRQYN
jgi:hypothetical protein